jgi:hypothetical protein
MRMMVAMMTNEESYLVVFTSYFTSTQSTELCSPFRLQTCQKQVNHIYTQSHCRITAEPTLTACRLHLIDDNLCLCLRVWECAWVMCVMCVCVTYGRVSDVCVNACLTCKLYIPIYTHTNASYIPVSLLIHITKHSHHITHSETRTSTSHRRLAHSKNTYNYLHVPHTSYTYNFMHILKYFLRK